MHVTSRKAWPCCDKIELTRLLFYSDIQPVLIGAIGPFATLAYQASRAFQGLLGPSCHYSLPPCHLATSLGTDFQQACQAVFKLVKAPFRIIKHFPQNLNYVLVSHFITNINIILYKL